jgi:gamma-glutamyltranspeptidase
MAFGNMGGSTQPLGHVQHIVNMIDLGYNVQATSDAAPLGPRTGIQRSQHGQPAA